MRPFPGVTRNNFENWRCFQTSPRRIALGTWKSLDISSPRAARDPWRHKELGRFDDDHVAKGPRHGVKLVRPGTMALTLYREDLAALADKDNQAVLAQFERYRNAPATGPRAVIVPDQAWRERFTDKAKKIEAYNEAVRATAREEGEAVEVEEIAGLKSDAAFPTLIKRLIPRGLRGFMFAAIAGAVISSLASMLNSASTVVTMDVYRRLINPDATEKRLVVLGRLLTLLFVIIGCLIAPALADPRFGGVFNFIQQFQGYIWPGVVAAFVIALVLPRAPGAAGVFALLAGPIIYGFFQLFTPEIHFLIQVAFSFLIILAVMAGITWLAPLDQPRTLPEREDMNMPNSRLAMVTGGLVICGVVAFFLVFW